MVKAEVNAEHIGIVNNLPLTANAIQKSVMTDPTTSKVIKYFRTGKWPKVEQFSPIFSYYCRRASLSITNDTLMFGHRIVIPSSFRQIVLNALHKAHPGTERMKKLARSCVYWPQIDSHIETMVRNCVDCQSAAKNSVKTTLEPWPTTSEPFERIHINYAGPINGIFYLVIVDSYSKYPEILPTLSITASTTIELLIPIFARFGNPRTLVSDNGTQFTSTTFANFCTSRGIRHLRSPPFHPHSNGQAERFVDTFRRALIKMKKEETTQNAIQTFLMTYRSTPCASSPNQLSPAENFIGRKMNTIFDLMLPTNLPSMSSSSQKMKLQFDRHHGVKPRFYSPGEAVFVKDFRSATWLPGTILACSGKVRYTVDCQGHQWIRHTNQLRRRDCCPTESLSSYSPTLLDSFDLPLPSPSQLPSPLSPSQCTPQSSPKQPVPSPPAASSSSGSSSDSSSSSPAQPPTATTPVLALLVLRVQPRHPYD